MSDPLAESLRPAALGPIWCDHSDAWVNGCLDCLAEAVRAYVIDRLADLTGEVTGLLQRAEAAEAKVADLERLVESLTGETVARIRGATP